MTAVVVYPSSSTFTNYNNEKDEIDAELLNNRDSSSSFVSETDSTEGEQISPALSADNSAADFSSHDVSHDGSVGGAIDEAFADESSDGEEEGTDDIVPTLTSIDHETDETSCCPDEPMPSPSPIKSIVSIASSSNLQYGGLNNLGNTCYMASAIQMIASVESFVESLKHEQPSNAADTKLRNAFLDLMKDLKAGETVSPEEFKDAIDERSSLFLGYRQQDAHEFLTTLLDLLDEDYKKKEVVKEAEEEEESEQSVENEHVVESEDNSEAHMSDYSNDFQAVCKKPRVDDPMETEKTVECASSSSSFGNSYSELDNSAIERLLHGDDAFITPDVSTTCFAPPVNNNHQYKLVGGRMNTSDVVLTPYSNETRDVAPSPQTVRMDTDEQAISENDSDSVSSAESDAECVKSPIDEQFTTSVRVRLTCDSCKYSRSHKETFLHLSIEINDCCSMEDGIRRFFAPCKQELKCEKCFCETATQTMEITRLPPALLLHFKRFIVDVSPDYSSITYRKNQSSVLFDENLSLDEDVGVLSEFLATDCVVSNNSYKLRSIVNHIGTSATFGHYTASAKRGGQWWNFNDACVSSTTNVTVQSRQTAYMVMYELDE